MVVLDIPRPGKASGIGHINDRADGKFNHPGDHIGLVKRGRDLVEVDGKEGNNREPKDIDVGKEGDDRDFLVKICGNVMGIFLENLRSKVEEALGQEHQGLVFNKC